MCVYCEIPQNVKDGFYNEHPELKGNENILRLQINIIGDLKCGKTSLIDAYGAKRFPSNISVSNYARYNLVKIFNKPAEIILYDTVGLESFSDPDKRSLMLKFSEATMLCYSVHSRESFTNISNQWFPEILASQSARPYFLVGLKKDRRDNQRTQTDSSNDLECVTFNEGKAFAKSIGAAAFTECSSVTGHGVKDTFEIALKKMFNESEEDTKAKHQSWRHLCCFT